MTVQIRHWMLLLLLLRRLHRWSTVDKSLIPSQLCRLASPRQQIDFSSDYLRGLSRAGVVGGLGRFDRVLVT